MERKVKVAQFGCGNMGKICMKYAIDNGAELVAAFVRNPDHIGKNVGMLIEGVDDDFGPVMVDSANFSEELDRVKPDIVILTTMSLMKDVFPIMLACAEKGVNLISTCEEAIYPEVSNPGLTQKLNEVAKANNCTLTGTGVQEFHWGTVVDNMAAALNKITRVEGLAKNSVDDFGIAFANSFGVGLMPDAFAAGVGAAYKISEEEEKEQIANGTFNPAFMWNSNAWLCDKMGFTITKQEQDLIPVIVEVDTPCATLDRVIPAGEVIGAKQQVITYTEEGLVIQSDLLGVVYGPDDYEINDWKVFSEGNETFTKMAEPPTVENTCAIIVNRILDIINCEPGFVPTSRMPACKYLVKPMNCYVND